MNNNLFHSLEGKQISFQSLSTNDVDEIHQYTSNPEVSRFIGWNLMTTLKETHDLIVTMIQRESAGTHLYASIVLKSTQEIIGTAMIFNFDHEAKQAEVGYVIHRNHWGKGVGSECVALMSDFGFNSLNLHKLHASVVDVNIGSALILKKNGYELEGSLKDHYFIDEKYYNALLFGKIQS